MLQMMGLVAPTIGQDTTGFDSTQARAICAIGTPLAVGDPLDRIDDRLIHVTVESLRHRVGRRAGSLLTPGPGRPPLREW